MKTATRISRVCEWPNKLGFDCTVNGCRFAVMDDRQIGKMVAIRLDRKGEYTHFLRVFNRRGIRWTKCRHTLAAGIYRLWSEHKAKWISYED